MNKKDIKPIWIDSTDWEDFKKGMYENGNNEEIIRKAKEILTSEELKDKMTLTTKTFPNATLVNFTNKMFNPVSWLGQATCNILANAKAQETCRAWLTMTKEEQDRANNIAKEVIEEWRANHEDI